MEVNSSLVVGSLNQNELILVIHRDDGSMHLSGNGSGHGCHICEDDVGINIDGEVFVACDECAFPICKTCYEYERSEGSQVCPQCKTRLKRLKGHARVEGDEEENDIDDLENELNYSRGHNEQELAKSAADQISCGAPNSNIHQVGAIHLGMEPYDNSLHPSMEGPSRQSLSRKVPISSRKINPYRMIIIIRLVVLGFFFHYRVTHPVYDAYALWLISVICEIWFALSWILDQFSKWLPVERETYLDRLSLRYEKEGQLSELSPVDIFVNVSTADDPLKDPPLALVIANTVLSILAVDYPIDKVSCYVSDDGASLLTFEVLSETSEFAKKWVPFCQKYNLEPRAPEWYFSHNLDYFNDKVLPPFVKERRAMKREYEVFKVRINSLIVKARMTLKEGRTMQDGSLWPGNDVHDHPGIIQILLGQDGGHGNDDQIQNDLPRLVYVAREKRPGFNHRQKSGAMNVLVRVSGVLSNAPYLLKLECDNYINNSKAVREAMCFMMDPQVGKRVCYVQFPVHDQYNAKRNTVFCNIRMKGLDGIQGPICVGTGTGCVFRRQALYGYDAPIKRKPPTRTRGCWCCGWRTCRTSDEFERNSRDEEQDPGDIEILKGNLEKRFGQSPIFVSSTLLEDGGIIPTGRTTSTSSLKEAIHVAGCGYEHKTEWGREVGWIYGSVTDDMLTGFKMHCSGWRSVYCVPAARPAFELGSATATATAAMNNNLSQVFCLALGSMEIFFSRHCPLWCGYGGGGLKWFQRFSYINAITYPWTSIPLLAYCTLPPLYLVTAKFMIPDTEVGGVGSFCFLSLFLCIVATGMLEMRWSGVGIDEWWRNQQLWLIGGVSGHLFAVFQGLLKLSVGVIDTNLAAIHLLIIPPTTLLIVNLIGVVVGVSNAINNNGGSNESIILPLPPLLANLFFALCVILHLYPAFVKALPLLRRHNLPLILSSIFLASIFSLSWLRIHPFLPNPNAPVLQECGLECN